LFAFECIVYRMPSRSPIETIPTVAFVAGLAPPTGAIVERLRALVLEVVPEALERVRPGWGLIGYDLPLVRHGAYFAWIWPQPEHVHLGFPSGVLMHDPDASLQGSGITKLARWLTYAAVDEIDRGRAPEVARRALEEAVRVARLSRPERELVRLEVEARR